MAKSKSGGTRSFIRGKIGADVYSIGKDGKGSKQQVVRSLAEVVSNPQTLAQMRGRMIMSTVMQAVSALSPFIDHSFDNVPNGQPSISEFISRNYALIKADVAAHPSSGNSFALNAYGVKGFKGGKFLISEGKYIPDANFMSGGFVQSGASGDYSYEVTLAGFGSNLSYAAWLALENLNLGDYITILGVMADGDIRYCRFHVSDTLPLDTILTADNVGSIFTTESNATPVIAIEQYSGAIKVLGDMVSAAFIVSHKNGSNWEHNTAQMVVGQGAAVEQLAAGTETVILPTYPQGASRFLNGGDI